MAEKFSIQDFVADFEESPSEDKVFGLKRAELFEVAKHYKISVAASMKKADLRAVILEHLVEVEILEESMVEKKQVEGYGHSVEAAIKLKQLELEIQLVASKKLDKELELFQLKQHSKSNEQSISAKKFDPTKFIRLVPPFKEKDVDKYFAHFEKVADRLEWPKDMRTLLLQSVLVGKAQEVYSTFPIDKSADYDLVKAAILKAYELVPEAYRQKFREKRKRENETYVEFAYEKKTLFNSWCRSCKVKEDFGMLRQLILLEEFKANMPYAVKAHLEEQKVTDLELAAVMADDFALTHKVSFLHANVQDHKKGNKTFVQSKPVSDNRPKTETKPQSTSDASSKGSTSNSFFDTSKQVQCNYCKKFGHAISVCNALKRKNAALAESKTVAFTNSTSLSSLNKFDHKRTSLSDIREEFMPFVSKGFVSLDERSDSPTYPVTILRDTGSTQSLLLKGEVPLSEESSLGTDVCITGIGNESFGVPLHQLYLQSDLVSGPISVGITPTLPSGLNGKTLLLGNEIAGAKVVVEPCMTSVPCSDNNTRLLEEEFPGIFPACVTTRSMSRKTKAPVHTDLDLDISETFMSSLSDEIPRVSFDKNVNSLDADNHSVPHDTKGSALLNELGVYSDIFLSREQLISEQSKDTDLVTLFNQAHTETETSSLAVCYFIKSGVLMRKWRPPDVPADNEWKVLYQIVVPSGYRSHILSLAHDIPMSGHLGVTKTCDRILQHFYWPGIRKSVTEYCRTCHTCQLVGKPNQKPPRAPLHPIPAFEEPFSRVIVDCVGPLPKTRSGHEYLLTIMCASTRYAEAIPLRSIKAKPVGEALRGFFTHFGLPKVVQSDQGSNFTSRLFQEQLYALGIDQITSSAYHPQSQGALERFHQTLKTMIRTYGMDNDKDWDEGIPLLMFAVREVVQESLGFSPFELVFGRTVRGPLKLVKEKWLSENTDDNILSYIVKLKDRLHNACKLAQSSLKATQDGMKTWYDKRSKVRTFNPGDKVLVLLPMPGQPLKARYSGPYVIDRKVNDLDYLISTPDRRKQKRVCHINMLKQYHERNEETVPVCNVNVEVEKPSENEGDQSSQIPGTSFRLKNSQVLSNLSDKLSHLTFQQQSEVSDLIREYSHLFPDVPGRTDAVFHDIDVGDATPIKQHPYRVGPFKQTYMNEEIKYMKVNGIIEESDSNWSSPCILVPKPDSSFRFCTDFRKVNSVSKSDTFPLPRVDDCIDRIGKAKFVSTFDLLKGYWQVPLTPRAKQVSAFVTPQGLYQYKVLPFGLKNAPATFQRLINKVIKGLPTTEVYIDDIVLFNDTWEGHMESIRALFERLTEAKLTVNLAKSQLVKAKVTFLGHVIGQGEVQPVKAKVEAIFNFPQPADKKDLMRFLGMAGYYRKFCENFSDVVAPLTNLLSKKNKFIWTDACSQAFEHVKIMLASEQVLKAPDFTNPFKLYVDASDVGVGSVLLQEDDNSFNHPVCYFSKKLNKQQVNYSTIEKECLALVLSLKHFEVYLSTPTQTITVYTDHNPLVFIQKMKNQNQRLLRWSLILQEFDIEVIHVKGKDNIIADALSRRL